MSRPPISTDFHAVFAALPGLYLVVAPDPPVFTILAASDAYLRATLRSREDVVGRPLLEAFPDNPGDPAATGTGSLAESLNTVLRTRRPDAMPVQRYDIRRRDPEGGGVEARYWKPLNSPVLGADGSALYLVHHVEDVTERRRAEAGLRESEERLRAVFQQTEAGIVQTDLDGRFVLANGRYAEIVGRSREELLGLRMQEITHPDDLPRNLVLFEQAARDGRPFVIEKRYLRPDGSEVWVSNSVSLMRDRDGRPSGIIAATIDITDRKRAEGEVARARADAERNLARWRAVVESMTEGLVLADAQGNLLTMNPAALAIHEFASVEEMLGRLSDYPDLFELRDGQGRSLSLEEWPLSRVLRGERFAGYEVEVHRRDTGSRWIASYGGTAVRDESGAVVLAVLTLRDVTAQKRAEAALREAEAHARRIIDNTLAFVGVMDPDGTLIEANATALRAGGLRREDVLGRKFWDCHWWSYDPDVQARLREAVATAGAGEVVRYDAVVRMAGDTRMPIDFMLSPVRDDQGRISHLIPSATDIAERKRAEDALREGELRLRTVTNAVPAFVWVGDPDGGVHHFNDRWYEYTGLTPGQSEGFGWSGVLHPDDLDRCLAVWQEARSRGAEYEIEVRYRRHDGTYRWYMARATPTRDAQRSISGWIGTSVDIDEQKQLQEQHAELLASERRARAEAERASRMKDEFLATLSHELRTPLNAILGWATILRGDAQDAKDLAEGLDVIERNARAQTQIIEDLLDMSRIISGKVRLDVQRLALEPVLRAAIETVRPAAEAKGIRLQPVLDPLAGPVSGDPNRLQQVFWNLLTNAVKFTPKGGRVQVLLERVNSHLEVSVIDTGEGIAPEFLPHVFDRFRQADASTTRRHGGLGLGLSIVKQLVELHGGAVRVKSAGPGHGTTFTVSLPLTVVHPGPEDGADRRHPSASPSAVSAVSAADECVRVDGVRVLVVDDEPDARALIRRLLENCNARVTTAGSAAEALELFRSERPDVLVSDIGMPQEDGYSLIRKIRALGPGADGNVPAIALTAYARAEDRVRAVLAGFDMHVAKPVEPTELVAVVASLARRR